MRSFFILTHDKREHRIHQQYDQEEEPGKYSEGQKVLCSDFDMIEKSHTQENGVRREVKEEEEGSVVLCTWRNLTFFKKRSQESKEVKEVPLTCFMARDK